MRRLVALIMTTLVASCTSLDYDISNLAPAVEPAARPTSTATGAVSVRNPRYGDRKPHPWTGRAPWTYPVHGTDVAKYQKDVDWRTAKASGISFVFIKATEGGDMVDERFQDHWRGARAAGIARSAYHFYYFCRPAHEQAAWFIRNVPREAGVMPHVLDMEWNHLSPTCKLRPSAETVQSEMRVWLRAVEKHFGKKPIIYTSIDFYRDNRLHEFKGYDWWLRSVSAHPDERYDGEKFLFWQYTGTGEVPGIAGDADINVFNGSEAQWRAWLQANGR